MKYIVLIVMLAGVMSAQTAKVIQLSPEDAATAKRLDAEQKALTARTEEFRKKVVVKYLVEPEPYLGGVVSGYNNCSLHAPEKGTIITPSWCYGFEFSDDWLYIVPKPAPAPASPPSSFYPVPAPFTGPIAHYN